MIYKRSFDKSVDFPENLIIDLNLENEVEYPLSQDSLKGVSYLIGTLPESCQEFIDLRYISKLSFKAIEKKMNMTATKVETLRSKALRGLKEEKWYIIKGYESYLKELREEAIKNQNSIRIESLNLDSRVYNALVRHDIRTVEELAQKTEKEILSMRNIGKLSLSELSSILQSYGLSFKQEKMIVCKYPTNLLYDMVIDDIEWDENKEEGLNYILGLLSDDERLAIKYVYQDDLNEEKVCTIMGTTRGELCSLLKSAFSTLNLNREYILNGYSNPKSECSVNEIEYLNIKYAGFSVSTANCLRRSGLRCLGELKLLTPEQLLRKRGIGEIKLKEIMDVMSSYGLSLKFN